MAMNKDLMEKFRAALAKRGCSNGRFKIDKWSEEDVKGFLFLAYSNEVEERRATLIQDEATMGMIAKAAKWLTGDHKPGLLLYGGVGNGKTTLAKAICKTIGILYDSAYSTERKGVCRISALEVARCANDSESFTRLKNQELLFIDDIGTEPANIKSWGNEISPVTELLYFRYDRLLFTIMTSNLNDEELKNRYGLRIADRLAEMFDRLYYQNRSYRK